MSEIRDDGDYIFLERYSVIGFTIDAENQVKPMTTMDVFQEPDFQDFFGFLDRETTIVTTIDGNSPSYTVREQLEKRCSTLGTKIDTTALQMALASKK
ncbi:hypothetical protein [Vibrio sp. OPT18]|uniref:hypothetical protein n=1 Tax=Vibrio sp. OPT18 TaxID=2778641 RepID=UPI001881AB1B|nr:hypothetical protein [Vibrio sp. OPT18]MBE8578652.1 hypothetical protein [Vibrio sp. OPT18]